MINISGKTSIAGPGSSLICYASGFDLNIKSLHNSKERAEEEWYQLFKTADPRFKIARIKRVAQSLLSIIEVIWRHTPEQGSAVV